MFLGTAALAQDFTESFENQGFIDSTNLTANLSAEEKAVYLAWSNSQQHRLPDSSTPGTDIGNDADYTLSVVLGDVNGDGHLDLVAGNYDETNKLYLNDGSGGFAASSTDIGDETDNTYSVVLGDVDGDGHLDLVAGNWYQTNKLYLNDGSGGFTAGTDGTAIGTETDGTLSVLLGDVNGDGHLDLVAGNNNGTNKLYLNSGSGAFFNADTDGTVIGNDIDFTYSVVLGDVNGDGHLDLVAGNNGQTNKLYLNSGSGAFFNAETAGTAIGNDQDKTRSVVLGDVDGDGDLDLVAGNDNQINKLYLNDGSGGFADSGTAIGSENDFTRSVVLGDVNGDGHLDLVAGNDGGTNKLYLNSGSGAFFNAGTAGTAIGSETDGTLSVVLGDVDGDGDLDLVPGNWDVTNKLYLNDGSGGFTAGTGTAIGSDTDLTYSVVLGDVDGDGDLDLVASN
jgi:hypothetical protein